MIWLSGRPYCSFDHEHSFIELPHDLTRLDCLLHVSINPPFADSRHPVLKLADPQTGDLCQFQTLALGYMDPLVTRVFDLLTVMHGLLDALKDDRDRETLLIECMPVVESLYQDQTDFTLLQAASTLEKRLSGWPVSRPHTFLAIGHAHIDTAYRWSLAETGHKAARAFARALYYMDRHPEMRMCASQAQHYKWVQDDYPELFERVREKVRQGRWEPVGGMWIECDGVAVSGESLAQQVARGQQFFETQVGEACGTGWLPDTVYLPPCLPQLLRLGGMGGILYSKLRRIRAMEFPHHTFAWRGIDGSRVVAHAPAAPASHAGVRIEKLADFATRSPARRRSDASLFPLGSNSGGPTAQQLRRLEVLSVIRSQPVVRFCEDISTVFSAQVDQLPNWDGALYVDSLRGTFTTFAMGKALMAAVERVLFALLLLGVAAAEYTDAEVDDWWTGLLMLQGHDMIAGTSLPSENARCISLLHITRTALEGRLTEGLERSCRETGVASVVFNPAPLPLSIIALTEAPVDANRWGDADLQVVDGGVLVRTHVPAYSTAPLGPPPSSTTPPAIATAGGGLRNMYVEVNFNDDGTILSIDDQRLGREIVDRSAPGFARFELFADFPARRDAWQLDPFPEKPVLAFGLNELIFSEVTARGPLCASRTSTWRIDDISITQVTRVYAGSPLIVFDTTVDWWADHKLLKVAFPIDVVTSRFWAGTQFGALDWPAHRNTVWDAAQFEVPFREWIDLSEGGYGVAVLSPAQFGCDVLGSTIRLSLLRAPMAPDPKIDRGAHRFRYAIFPHEGDFRASDVPAEAVRFASGPYVYIDREGTRQVGSTTRTGYSSSLIDVEGGMLLAACQRLDDGALLVRLYEPIGARGVCVVTLPLPCSSAVVVDLRNRRIRDLAVSTNSIRLDYRPFEVITLRCLPATCEVATR